MNKVFSGFGLKTLIYVLFYLSLSFNLQAQSVQLLDLMDTPRTEWVGKQVADIKQAEVEIHESALDQIRNGDITEFNVAGFNGTEYSVEVRRVIQQLDGDWSVIGWINGNWENPFILSYSEGEVLSTLRETSNHNFMKIRYDYGLQSHLLIELDPHEQDDIECGVDHELAVPNKGDDETENIRQGNLDTSFNNSTVIDVMVVYTPSADSWAASNSSGIQNVINQAMAIAQNSVDNSRVDLVFRLVHSAKVNYSETGDSATDLVNLTNGDISNVHELRNEYGADLVSMFTNTDDTGGIAWLMIYPEGYSEYGYSISRVQQAAWTTTHAHEMGHNFGNQHSRNQVSSPASSAGGVYTFSTGWRWTGSSGNSYASVMTYGEGSTNLDVFSNPNVSYDGIPTGSYTGTYSPADNARSMGAMMDVIAGYRSMNTGEQLPSVLTSDVSDISYRSARSGGEVTSNGGSEVTSRGVCWSTNQDPGLADQCRSSGSGTGAFNVDIENLSTNTRYYARAYATNSVGTSYGEQISFTTLQIMVDASLSSIHTGQTKVQANNKNSSTITVTARDYNGERLHNFSTQLTAKQGTLQSSPTVKNTNTNGEAVFTVTNNNVEEVEYGAISGGIELTSTVKIRFIGIDAQLSSIEASSEKVQADGNATADITIYARDEDDNTFSNLMIELLPDGGSSTIETIQNPTNDNGVARFRVSNQIAEEIRYTARGLGTTVADYAEVNFVTIDPVLSRITASSDSVIADGQNEVTVKVTARDKDNDPIQGVLIRLTDGDKGTTIEPQEQRTDNNGEATYFITSTNTGFVDYTATAIRLGGNIEINEKARIAFIPVAPVALSASKVGTRSLTANWEAVSGADGYELDLARDSSFSSTITGYQSVDTGNVTSFNISELSPGTNYYYRVRAKKGALIGANSQIIFTITYPEAPVAMAATHQNALQFTANWQEAEGARSYRFELANDVEFENTVSSYNDLEIEELTSLVVNNLQPGTEYHYRLRSKAGFRTSNYSNSVSASTLTISAEQSRIEQQQLRILANGSQTNQIIIEVKSENGVALNGLEVVLFPDNSESEEPTLSSVTNEDGNANIELSSSVAGIVNYKVETYGVVLGEFKVEYLADRGNLVLGNNYPNPFKKRTILPVTVPSTMPIEIRVYDILGQPVRTPINEVVEPGHYEVPFSAYGLSSGVYFYRLFANGKILTERMVMVK